MSNTILRGNKLVARGGFLVKRSPQESFVPTAEEYFTFAEGMITGYTGGADVVIPQTIGGVSVTGIADYAFASTPSSIAITSLPTQTTYSVGELLNLSGMVVEATYDDSSVDTLDPIEYVVTGFDSSSATASQTITVEYMTCTASFAIAVV